MTAEFDEEVVFENSPLYQYLQDLGHTDFEICPAVTPEERVSENGSRGQGNTTAEAYTRECLVVCKAGTLLFQKRKKMKESICWILDSDSIACEQSCCRKS